MKIVRTHVATARLQPFDILGETHRGWMIAYQLSSTSSPLAARRSGLAGAGAGQAAGGEADEDAQDRLQDVRERAPHARVPVDGAEGR